MNNNIRYFFQKVKKRLLIEKNRLWKHMPIEKISLWSIDTTPTKIEFVERLEKILGAQLGDVICAPSEEERNVIVESAESTLRHEFDLLGSGMVKLEPFQWNKDFKTGFEWNDGIFYRKILATTPRGTDIKIPWELSRCHHLLWLGEAYLLTRDEKYAKELVYELNDWIEKNPLMYTVNWTCAMDVAIRSVNWLYALVFIKNSKNLTDELIDKVYKSLYQHGFFIINNLEKVIPYSNNHYFSDIVGLLYLGQLFKQTRTGAKWFRFALKEYYKETLIQNLPSGVNYEKSVSYHRLMTELSLFPYYMLVRVGVNVPVIIKERLSKMVDYIRINAMPNGNAPMIADNDDGRFLPFVPRDFRKHGYLSQSDSTEMLIITSGIEQLPCHTAKVESYLIQDAKIAILRRGNCYLFVNNADRWRFDKDTGKYIGTHMHSDLLSFVYAVGESEIFIDPGAYVYTSDLQKHVEFRSTAKHNTIVVDEEEQHQREMPNAFMMKYNASSSYLTFYQKDEYDVCSGNYKTIAGNMTHNRVFQLSNTELRIIDKITKAKFGHHAVLYYHLAPGIIPTIFKDEIHFSVGEKSFIMSFQSKDALNIAIADDTFSPSFGNLQSSKTISIGVNFNEQSYIHTKIRYE